MPDGHSQGDADARCTLVENGDYQCLACGQAVPVVEALQTQSGTDPRFVFHGFPLSDIRPNAKHAAETAAFAGTNDELWQMHDPLYQRAALDDENLPVLASRLHLSQDEFRKALHAEMYQPWVKKDFRICMRSGVNGALTFFVNGQRHDGGFDSDMLADAVQQLKTTEKSLWI